MRSSLYGVIGAIGLAAGAAGQTAHPAPLLPSGFDARDEVLYQIMPIAWRHGEARAGLPAVASEHRFGNFAGMKDSLPYLDELGITGVWMTPIFPSPAYHGYQHGPADGVNPWFGEEAEFWAFVGAAREREIKVYIDFVVYGLNQDSAMFESARRDAESPFRDFFAFSDAAREKPFGYSFKTWNGDTVRFVNWDLRQPGPRAVVQDWARRWLDPNADGDASDGVAGFRLDHVWSTYAPQGKVAPGGWGYNTEFWVEWKRGLQAVKPDVMTFAEQAKWETWGTDLLAAHDAAFTKPFEFAARDALREERAEKLYMSMAAAVKAVPEGRTLLGIIGDHDVDRVASDVRADEPGQAGRAKAAAAVLMLQPFPPVIYYGDEIGMLGRAGKFVSDSNDIPRREPMKWLAKDGAPMTRYHALDFRTVAAQYSRDGDGRSVEEQQGVAGSLLETYRALIALRRGNIALRRGGYEPLECGHPGVWRFRRVHEAQAVEVAINLTGAEVVGAAGLPYSVPAYGYVVTPVEP
jgi:alpha-amylase